MSALDVFMVKWNFVIQLAGEDMYFAIWIKEFQIGKQGSSKYHVTQFSDLNYEYLWCIYIFRYVIHIRDN